MEEGQKDASSRLEPLRRRSKALFGNRYLLEVIAEVADAEDGRVYARELSGRTGIPDASLKAPLDRLVAGGFLRPLGESRGALPRMLERRDSPLWELALALRDDAGPSVIQT
jgi:hypothetical protein